MRAVKIIPVMLLAGLTLGLAPQALRAQSHSHAAVQANGSDPLQEAETLLQAQQYAQAEEKLQPLMKAQAKNPQAWFDLGFAQSHQHKREEAISSYQKAVDLAPDWFEANLNLAVDLAASGDSAAAVTLLKHAVELKPTSGGQQALGRAWLSLAEALESADPKSAATAYEKAEKLNPPDPEITARLGIALLNSGDAAAAEQHFRKAAEGGSWTAKQQLVYLLHGPERDAAEVALMTELANRNPQDLMIRHQLALTLIKAGKTEEAVATLEALRATPAGPEIGRELASLYLDKKQYDKAADILQDLSQKKPGDAQLHWDLGSALLHQHKYPEAEKEMFEALRINPQMNAKLEGDYWELAYAAQQNKHYELAIRVLDARGQRMPETPTTYWIRAVSYDSLGAVKPAAANYKLFLATDAGKLPDEEFKARHRLKAIEH